MNADSKAEMMKIMLSLLSILLWMTNMAAAMSRTGYATAYSSPGKMNKTGRNACGFNPKSLSKRWQKYFVAVNQKDWNSAGGKSGICGKCVKVKGISGQTRRGHRIRTVYAKVVDMCPSKYCKKGHVDFSTNALQDVTGFSWDKKRVKWTLTKCPSK